MNNFFLKSKRAELLSYKNSFFWLFLTFSTISLRAQNPPINLSDCLKKAREYHPYYSDKQRIDQSRDLRMKNINSLWLPQIGLNAQATYQSEAIKIDVPIPGFNISGTPLDQYKITLDVNQAVFDGGNINAQKKLTNASIEADFQQNEIDIYKINEQLVNVYFNTLLLQVNRDLYKNILEDLGSKEQKITSGVRNGILIQSDLDNLKVEILKTKQLLNDLEISYKNSLSVLSDLTGDSIIRNSKLTTPELRILANDSINRPELKLFDLQKGILEGSKYVSSSQRMPKFYAFSQLGYGRPGLNMLKDDFQPFYIVGLKFQWNIWDWNKTSREKSIYSVQQEIVGSKKELYMRNISISSNNELTKIQQLEGALETDEEIHALRKSISQQTEKRLEQGIVTMTDYLTEYNATIKAGLQLEIHKVQLLYSKANYLIIKGQL